ncbi:DUF4965 domain-containing protein [bacterium]|nr:DUF4965 domain-containing protein [bacterium]
MRRKFIRQSCSLLIYSSGVESDRPERRVSLFVKDRVEHILNYHNKTGWLINIHFWLLIMSLIPVVSGETSNGLKPCMLARLGSRLTVIPEPDLGRIRVLPLGHHLPEFQGLQVKWITDSSVSSFPDPAGVLPGNLVQKIGPTSVTFEYPVKDSKQILEYRLWSPFCPDLPDWRSTSVMFFELTIRNTSEVPSAGVLEFQLASEGDILQTESQSTAGLLYCWEFSLDQEKHSSSDIVEFIAPQVAAKVVPSKDVTQFRVNGSGDFVACGLQKDGWSYDQGVLKADVMIPPGASIQKRLAISFRTQSPVLKVDGQPCTILVPDPKVDVLATARTALKNYELIMNSNRRFENELLHGFHTEYQIELVSLGFQSFLSNTWIIRNPDGSPRYSEWEGRPLYHSTLDVVYNTSLFHLKYTPDLLANLLRQRPAYNQKNHLSHDIGKGLVIGKNSYPVKMIVEEDTNYILLQYMYARATGDFSIIREQTHLLKTLTEGLINADTDGDGLPNKGTINTFDDASSSINSAENQLYLGVKTAAALYAIQLMGRNVPELLQNRGKRISTVIQTIVDTINGSWLGDHYPINLASEKSKSKFVVLPYTKHQTSNPKPTASDSSDGYSNYIAHGLVPLLLFGEEEPAKWFEHMATHLENAHQKTNTEYGDAHRDGSTNVWISQNMWRDLAAAYLGSDLDFQKLHKQYWHNQEECFRRSRQVFDDKKQAPWLGFCDSPESSFLTYYSRGIPIIMLPQALSQTSFTRTGTP